MILIKNVNVYAPEFLGKKDVLVAGEKIIQIDEEIKPWTEEIQVIEGNERALLPGFIDQHVHITGGGGEGGFKTRVPEITFSKITKAGITTVVGLLGTDGSTRSVENLVAKAKSLKEEGLSAYALTGSYEYPSINLTGHVKKDVCFIEEIIGCKIAISDHRGPNVTVDELCRLVSDIRIGGMISSKAGIVTMHLGNGKGGLKPILDVLDKTDLPIKNMRPTHVNRDKKLLEESFEFAKLGGIIDLTCGIGGYFTPTQSIIEAIEKNIPTENITLSSDGNGSTPLFNESGELIGIGAGSVGNLYKEFEIMIKDYNMKIEDALVYFTSNVAKALSLYPKKGSISVGSDADIILVDKDLSIDYVICRGQVAIKEKKQIMFGTFE